MIKVEICECTNPINRFFERGRLYLLHTAKGSSDMVAYISPTQGFAIPHDFRIRTNCPQYQLYFNPIGTIFMKNFKEVKELREKALSTQKRS